MTRRQRIQAYLLPGVLAWTLPVLSPAAFGDTRYVKQNAIGANDGTTWEDAFTELQSALAAAVPGDEIWVGSGTYQPDRDGAHPGGTGSRTATFQLITGVAVRGGFAGNEDPGTFNLADRDFVAHASVLSGDLAGNDGADFANNGENSHHVVTCSDTDASAILDGFTISGGNADDTSNRLGGGVYNTDGSPTLTNCVLTGNSANVYGGGMDGGSGKPVLTNCTFGGNRTVSGGYGAGMCIHNGSAVLTNCAFRGNSATSGSGGGMFNHGGVTTLTNCAFSGNTAASGKVGGGIYNHGTATLTNCTFSSNTAGQGGAIYHWWSTATLNNCILWGNTASSSPQIGGATEAVTVTYSCIQGGWAGTGNISGDPRLASDLQVRRGSPCIDAGNNAALLEDTCDLDQDGDTAEATPLDLANRARRINDPDAPDTGGGSAPLVDMGAYEYQPVAAKWIYVNIGASSGGDGLSWATAYQYLQEALTAAQNDSAVTGIWVGSGTYQPDRDGAHPGGTGSRTATFQLITGVAVRGGFAGNEDPGTFNLADRDFVAHASVLSGDLAGNDGADFANNGENSHHVVTCSDTDASAILDGFTISGGNADDTSNRLGGGVYNTDGSPTLTNCVLTGNSANVYGGGMYSGSGESVLANCTFEGNRTSGGYGAGMCVEYGSAVLTNCAFRGNSATSGSGGGMFNRGGVVTLTNCAFSGNTAASGKVGGGIYNHGTATLTNCTFSGNTAGQGGAIYHWFSTATLNNCVFTGNSANVYGGGMYSGSGKSVLTNCTFDGNKTSSGGYGAGMCNEDGNAVLTNCAFRGNSAASGGGMFNRGGVATLTNCAFIGNTAIIDRVGGGIYNSGTATLTNCTFSGNTAGQGGAIYHWGATATLNNCILWGNTAQDGPQIGGATGAVTVTYGCIQGGWQGEGNIDAAPLLTPDGHIRTGSPCIGVGNPEFVADPNALTDINGDPRVINGRVDIGVDEFLDTDTDGLPDWWETKYFGSPTPADPNGHGDTDGRTNLQEYELYSSNPTAAPYFVNTETGNDAWDGLSLTYQSGTTGPKRTIQAAIDVAKDGDSVVVAHGTYSGAGNKDLDFGGKALVVHSRFGPRYTVVDCGGDSRAVNADLIKGTFAVLEGFTVQNGAADLGGGVRSDQSRLMLKNCILKDNIAGTSGGAFYSNLSSKTICGLTIGSGNSAPAGVISRSSVNLAGPLTLVADPTQALRLELNSSWFYGPGSIELGQGTTLQLTGSPGNPPTVLRSNVGGLGNINIPLGQELDVEGGAIVDLSGGAGGNCANGCVVTDSVSWGRITVDGKLVVRCATVRNTNVQVTLAEFSGGVDIINNDIRLLETSTGYGGEFFVEGTSKIECNTIRSEGDRYLDVDPDPSILSADRPTICGNEIHAVIKEGILGSQGTLLELRGLDYDSLGPNNPTGASGAFPAPGSPGFTADPSANWVLEELEILPGAKLNLTNRPGFEFQTGTTPLETVYVKNLILHENAVLNTALQTLYYENLVQHPTSRIVDEPLLGFSLGIIAMDDPTLAPHNEFDIRIRKRLRDPGDTQLCQCDGACVDNNPPKDPTTCLEGSVERLDETLVQQEIPGLDTGGGVMDMRTQAPDRQSASSVAAKGAFARAGDEDIVVTFEYLFREADANSKLIVHLSDKPNVGENLVQVAELRPPPADILGGTSSNKFAVFWGRFPRGNLNFTRGTYVELELRGAGSRVWIDDFDPQVWCQGVCGNFSEMPGVDDQDYLVLLAEAHRPLPYGKWCLDVSGDGYVDLSDVLAWDVVYNTRLNLCPAEPEGQASEVRAGSAKNVNVSNDVLSDGLLIAGKPTGGGLQDMLYDAVSTNGTGTAVGVSVPCPGTDCTRGNARLVEDAPGSVYLVHGVYGLVRKDTGTVVVRPENDKPWQGGTVSVGVEVDEDGSALSDESIPLSDAAFHPSDTGSQYVYVVPVRVTPSGSCWSYKAAATLELLGNGDYNVAAIFGVNLYDPAIQQLYPCLNCTPSDCSGSCRPACDLSGMREIEVDAQGNVYVASATGYNENDWVLIYNEASSNPGFETARVNLNTMFAGQEFPVPSGPCALHVSSAFTDRLYLASSVNESGGLTTRVYRFGIQRSGDTATGLTFAGVVEIDGQNAPPDICGQISCDEGYVSGITSLAESAGGALYVVGYTAPKFPEDDPLSASEMFTTPTVAFIPPGTVWSTSAELISRMMAVKVSGCDLSLPQSAVFVPAVCHSPTSNLDGDSDVDGFDFLTFANCFNGSDKQPLAACENTCSDLDRDGDVDGFDFLTFSNCYNGANRPPLCP